VLMAMAFSQKRWLLIVVFVVMLALVLVHFFSFTTMIYSRGTANTPGHPNSMANHPLRCCAGDVYADPSSDCDNAGPCDLPVPQFPNIHLPLSSSQIPYNSTHVLIFWMMFSLLILDIVTIVLLVNLYVGQNTVKLAGNALIQALWAPRTATRQVIAAAAPAVFYAMGYNKKFDIAGKLE